MDVGEDNELEFSDKLESDGTMQVGLEDSYSGMFEYINADDAKAIIAHLQKVFDLASSND